MNALSLAQWKANPRARGPRPKAGSGRVPIPGRRPSLSVGRYATSLVARLIRRALHETVIPDAGGRGRIAVAVVSLREVEHAFAPGIAVALVAEFLAARPVKLDHLLDLALHLGGAFSLCCAAGDKEQNQ